MKIIPLLVMTASLFMGIAHNALADQKPVAATPSSIDFYPFPGRTLAQFLADGWEVKNGEAPGWGSIAVHMTKGRDYTVCFLSNTDPRTGKKTGDGMFSSCMSTIRP